MSYEYKLAKKLKELGFPEMRHSECRRYVTYALEKSLPIPTLSELIKACGIENKEFILQQSEATKNNFTWYAFFRNNIEVNGEGKTPSIAVANLWIEINKK